MEGKMSWMRKSNNRPDSANTIVQPTLQFPSERITIIIISRSLLIGFLVLTLSSDWLKAGTELRTWK